MNQPRLAALAAIAALALVVAACGDDDTTTTTAATTTTAPTTTTGAGATTAPSTGDATITISNFQFAPAELSIPAGSTVTFLWVNGTHTTTATDGAWASGSKSGGATFEVTLDEPGTYEFFCEFHASMRGTLTVTG